MKKSLLMTLVAILAISMLALGCKKEENANTDTAVTDTGAEDVINGQHLGGWYDYAAWENGDKCAWKWAR